MMSTAYPDVAEAVETYFATRTQGPWAISTARAMTRIRKQVPDSGIADEELVRMIADYAIARGHNVSFDAREISQG